LMGKGAPAGMAQLSQMMGGIRKEDVEKFQKDPALLIQKLQEYAAKEKNVGLRNQVLESFGIGDNMKAAMAKGAFNQAALAKAPTYSDKEIGSLDKANIAWSNLGSKIEMAMGRFNAKHGVELVDGISKIVDQVLKLIEAFMLLAEKLNAFKWIGEMFKGWTMLLTGASSAVGSITGAIGDSKQREALGANIGGFIGEAPGVFKEMLKDVFSMNGGESAMATSPGVLPSVPKGGSSYKQNTFNINQNMNFSHDGKDHSKIAASHKEAGKYVQQVATRNQAN
jgi:hypothetical protein